MALPWDSLLQSTILRFITVATTATGGIFLVVILSGVLSALLTLGALELFFRARIQRSVLLKYFARMDFGDFARFVSRRYNIPLSPDVNRAIAQPTVQVQPGDPAIVVYSKSIANQFYARNFVSSLAQLDPNTFYQLHYRQLCGQLATVVTNEGLLFQTRRTFTPLSDVLAYISEKKAGTLNILTRTSESVEPSSDPNIISIEDRYYLEKALRQIDAIQAELGNRINNVVYGYAVALWALFYFIILFFGASANLRIPGQAGFWAVAGQVVEVVATMIFAFLVAMALAVGTAVFSSATFTWLDRVFASK
jgi:hypothetical protein